MNDYMQSLFSPNFETFNSFDEYHHKPQVKLEESYNDAFGFDPIPDQGISLDQHNQLPYQFSLAFLEQQHNLSARVPIVQNSCSSTLDTFSVSGGGSAPSHHGVVTLARKISAQNRFLEAVGGAAGTAEDSEIKKTRRKVQAMSPLAPSNKKNTPSKARRKGGRKAGDSVNHLFTASQDDRRKLLSLEKNRVAAAKCRINRKEKIEQMQQDSHEKVKENKQLRGLIGSLEDEIHSLIVHLSEHAQSSMCKKAEQLKLALEMVQEADMSKRFPGLGKGSPSTHSPILSMLDQSSGSDSRRDSDMTANRSSATETPPTEFDFFADLAVDSPVSV